MPTSSENVSVVTEARPSSWTEEVNHNLISRTGTTIPVIVEVNDAKDRALVRFVTHGLSGSFQGTCLYALKDDEWGFYTIKPSASETRGNLVEQARLGGLGLMPAGDAQRVWFPGVIEELKRSWLKAVDWK